MACFVGTSEIPRVTDCGPHRSCSDCPTWSSASQPSWCERPVNTQGTFTAWLAASFLLGAGTAMVYPVAEVLDAV